MFNIKSVIMQSPSLLRFERFTATTTNPNLSIIHTALIKIRVLIEFVVRSLTESRGPRGWKKSYNEFRLRTVNSTALVLANGPSLATLNAETVAEMQKSNQLSVFAINFFFETELARCIRVDYLILSDPFMHPENTDARNQKLWTDLGANVTCTVVVPSSWARHVEGLALKNRVMHFDDRALTPWSQNTLPTRPRGYISLTALKALAVASAGSFAKIFILGFDNSVYQTLSVTEDNTLVQGANHHGNSGNAKPAPLNHLYPKGMADYFYAYSQAFLSFRPFMKDHRIVNLDPWSKTDTFAKAPHDHELTVRV